MNSSGTAANGIGQPVWRKEDFRLLTGRGSFADDLHLPEITHAVIVRAPHAHAQIGSIDKAAALASPGVLAVPTGRDYVADGLGPIPLSSSSPRLWPTGGARRPCCRVGASAKRPVMRATA